MSKPNWLRWVLNRLGMDDEIEYEPVTSPALMRQNQQVIDAVFQANERLVHVLSLLEPHQEDPAAAAEIKRVTAYRSLLIEFAAMAAEDQGDLLGETLFQKADRWIEEVLLDAKRHNVDADTFEGYMRMKKQLDRRVVEPPGLQTSF